MSITISSREPIQTYRDPLTCGECGYFQSRHDAQCSQWQETAAT